MKILSKFYDYYDNAAAFGVDDHVILKRLRDRLPNEVLNDVDIIDDMPYIDMRGFDTSATIIGFCGKLYVTIKISYTISILETISAFVYQVDDMVKYLTKIDALHRNNNFLKSFMKKPIKNSWSGKYDMKFTSLDNYFNNHQGTTKFENIFIKNRIPMFELHLNYKRRSDIIETYPVLKDLHFQKVFDPYTAYQEIEMYVSGVLGQGTDELIQIDDKYRLTGHGFNQCSFRKPPTKRKTKCSG